jgi:hypothetical protein
MIEKLELLKIRLLELMNIKTEDAMFRRLNGLDWNGYTMIGLRRLDNLEFCINDIVKNNIPGAIVEAGVWRGGACIFMNGVLKELGVDRTIYVCDIFSGTFPKPTNADDDWTEKHDFSPLAVELSHVKKAFEKFGLLTDNVVFKEGWFSDTLPTIREDVAILRIDGDTYQSTIDSLWLEPQVPKGGYIIMDDWAIASSKKAFLDYFAGRVTEQDVVPVDSLSVYWKKV